MKNENNIEDIFRDAFQDAKEEPSQKVWSSLNKKLFVKNFAQKFADFTLEPSEKVWIAINRKLIWKQFLRFSIAKFNIYYASVLTFLAIFGILYLQSDDKNTESRNNITILENKGVINNNSFKYANISKLNKKDYNYKTNDNKLSSLNKSKNINKPEQNNSTNNDTKIVSNNGNYINTKTSKTKTNNNTQQNFGLNNTSVLNHDIAVNSTVNNNSTSQNSIISNTEKTSINKTQVVDDDFIILNKLYVSNLYNPVDSFYNIYNPDTVGVDAFGNIITIDKNQIFVDVFASVQLNKYNFASQSSDNTYSKLISDATKGKESYAFGARLTYFYKNYLFQTGVGITNFTEKINYDYNTQQITTSNFYTYFNTQQTVYDTIQIINLDSLLANGDTAYTQYIKQNTITVIDSSLQTKIDTNTIKQNLNTRNVYTYVEIPAIIGYRFSQNKFSYDLSGGAIFGLFIKDKGSVISQTNLNQIQELNKNLPYIKPNISAIVKLGITYKITDRISILAEPFYRRNINSWFDKSSVYEKRNSAYGITLGTRIFIK